MIFNSLIFRLIIPITKSLVKAGCCRLLKPRGNVAVGIKGYLYAGVPQLIIYASLVLPWKDASVKGQLFIPHPKRGSSIMDKPLPFREGGGYLALAVGAPRVALGDTPPVAWTFLSVASLSVAYPLACLVLTAIRLKDEYIEVRDRVVACD